MNEDKVQADSVVIVLHRTDYGWTGELIVNGASASGATGPSHFALLDGLLDSAFNDKVSGDAYYTWDRV